MDDDLISDFVSTGNGPELQTMKKLHHTTKCIQWDQKSTKILRAFWFKWVRILGLKTRCRAIKRALSLSKVFESFESRRSFRSQLIYPNFRIQKFLPKISFNPTSSLLAIWLTAETVRCNLQPERCRWTYVEMNKLKVFGSIWKNLKAFERIWKRQQFVRPKRSQVHRPSSITRGKP